MNHNYKTMDAAWHRLMSDILMLGFARQDRTGVGTIGLFGETLSVDLRLGFPAVTTKKLFIRTVWAELACFIQGERSLEAFHARDCKIWDADGSAAAWVEHGAQFDGDLGRIYGVQWREWQSVGRYGETITTDQLLKLTSELKSNPYSRRHLVTAFNPGELGQQCLPPCHVLFQCYCSADGYLDMLVFMRSVDVFLGLPFDVASYATLLHLLALEVGRPPRRLVFHLGDAHLYKNHLAQAREVLTRQAYAPPSLDLGDGLLGTRLFDFDHTKPCLINYLHHPAVKAELNTAKGYEAPHA